MENLAGRADADRLVALELHTAGIKVGVDPDQGGEVPTVLYGHRIGFIFERAWYYWVVRGHVSLDVAKWLYDHPVGKKDIRVAGHCGCPPPEDPWVNYVAGNGKHIAVLSDNDRELFNKHDQGKLSALMGRHVENVRRSNIFVETPEERDDLAVFTFIDTYHIDSQEGLNLFVAKVCS